MVLGGDVLLFIAIAVIEKPLVKLGKRSSIQVQ